jgi:hypothetical protein
VFGQNDVGYKAFETDFAKVEIFFGAGKVIELKRKPLMTWTGTDVMIFIIFSQKNWAKQLPFFSPKLQPACTKIVSLHWFLRNTPIISPNIDENG